MLGIYFRPYVGHRFYRTYSPLPIGSKQFFTIPDQTAKVFGMSEEVEIVLPIEIERNCVVASHNKSSLPINLFLPRFPMNQIKLIALFCLFLFTLKVPKGSCILTWK